MKTTLLALLLSAMPSAGQPVPKKYDPATLQSMQSSIAKLSADLSSFRAEITVFHQRTIAQMNQRINTLTMDIKTIRSQMEDLDVVQDTKRLTQLEDKVKQDEVDQARRDAASKYYYDSLMGFLRWLGVMIGGLIIHGLWDYFRKNKREKRTEHSLEKIEKQTNGALAKLLTDNEKLEAENKALREVVGQ